MRTSRPRSALLLVTSVLLIASACLLLTSAASSVDAKGFTGGARARGGGYARSTKTGYLSSRYYYSTSRMYWRSGYMYSYKGPSYRTGGGYAQDPNANVMCRRLVVADTNAANEQFKTFVVYNSTQRCYIEVDSNAGSKRNIPVDNIMLNRYRFNLSIAPFPQVDMQVFADKDFATPTVNVSLRVTELGFSRSRDTIDLAARINVSELRWMPCSLDTCEANPASAPASMGYPSSRFLEASRVDFSAVKAVWRDCLEVELRWWLSSDFSEDSSYDHVFLFPGAVKFDINARTIDAARLRAELGTAQPVYFAVSAIMAGPAEGQGSQLMYLPTQAGLEATEYDPQDMERLHLGTAVDAQNGNAAFVSFANADNREQLCFPDQPLDDASTCVRLLDRVNLTSTVRCRGTSAAADVPEDCRGLLLPSQVGYLARWLFQGAFPLTNYDDADTNSSARPVMNWFVNVGFVDPSVQVLGAVSYACRAAAAFVFVVLCFA